MDHSKRILLLDSNPAIHEDFHKILGKKSEARFIEVTTTSPHPTYKEKKILQTYTIDSAYTGEEALGYLKKAKKEKNPYTAAFIDLHLTSEWDGIQTIQRLWEIDPDLQIVICISFSAYSWQDIAEKLHHSDHFFIINKPFDVVEIRQLVFYLTRRQEQNKMNQEKMDALKEKIHYQAEHDSLTGLANRLVLNDHLTNAIVEAKKRGLSFGIVLFSFDNLNELNLLLTYSEYAAFLKILVEKCEAVFRKTGRLIFFGENTFLAILENMNEESVNAKINELQTAFLTPFIFEKQAFYASLNAGIAMYPYNGHEANSLVKNAEMALAFSKGQHQKKIQFYDKGLHDVIMRRTELIISLPYALHHKQFVLYYQPLVKADSSRILGVEVLLRWEHPQLGLLYPQEFIPLAVEMGLMSAIGEWVLKTACAKAKKWQDTIYPELAIAVNISSDQLSQSNFDGLVQGILKKSELESHYLELEIIANSKLMDDPDVLRRMHKLKEIGVRFSLDNFGVGYSNLNYLHYFPFDKLKIDRAFIKNIGSGKKANKEIEMILDLAKKWGIRVVAEGVETAEQVEFLFNHHGEEMQGFYFSPPLNEEACAILLEQQRAVIKSIEG